MNQQGNTKSSSFYYARTARKNIQTALCGTFSNRSIKRWTIIFLQRDLGFKAVTRNYFHMKRITLLSDHFIDMTSKIFLYPTKTSNGPFLENKQICRDETSSLLCISNVIFIQYMNNEAFTFKQNRLFAANL